MKKASRPDLRPMREKTLEELEGVVAGDPPLDRISSERSTRCGEADR
jgi:hypothetical protein